MVVLRSKASCNFIFIFEVSIFVQQHIGVLKQSHVLRDLSINFTLFSSLCYRLALSREEKQALYLNIDDPTKRDMLLLFLERHFCMRIFTGIP